MYEINKKGFIVPFQSKKINKTHSQKLWQLVTLTIQSQDVTFIHLNPSNDLPTTQGLFILREEGSWGNLKPTVQLLLDITNYYTIFSTG